MVVLDFRKSYSILTHELYALRHHHFFPQNRHLHLNIKISYFLCNILSLNTKQWTYLYIHYIYMYIHFAT